MFSAWCCCKPEWLKNFPKSYSSSFCTSSVCLINRLSQEMIVHVSVLTSGKPLFVKHFYILIKLYMNEFDKSVFVQQMKALRLINLLKLIHENLYNSQAMWWLTDVYTNTVWKCLLDFILFLLALPQNIEWEHALLQILYVFNQTLVWILPAIFLSTVFRPTG